MQQHTYRKLHKGLSVQNTHARTQIAVGIFIMHDCHLVVGVSISLGLNAHLLCAQSNKTFHNLIKS